MKLITILGLALFLASPITTTAQMDVDELPNDLEKEILRMDSILFSAFNARDLEKTESMFTDDLEFYHDKGGLSHYEDNIAAFRDLFSRDYVLERTLVPGSTEVYPIPNFGAVQVGSHEFCHEENGRMDCGTFKFVHLWKKEEDGSWKISRVISYDH